MLCLSLRKPGSALDGSLSSLLKAKLYVAKTLGGLTDFLGSLNFATDDVDLLTNY